MNFYYLILTNLNLTDVFTDLMRTKTPFYNMPSRVK